MGLKGKHAMISDNLGLIWNRLQDDISRTLFLGRLNYFFDGNEEHFFPVIDELVAAWNEKHASDDRKPNQRIGDLYDGGMQTHDVVIYGAGGHGQGILSYLRYHGVNVVCYCDGDSSKQGTRLNGLPVISPSELAECHGSCRVLIAVQSAEFTIEIYELLLKLGFDDKSIFCLPTLWEDEYFNTEIFQPVDDEIYIDAGTYNGDTMRDFVRFCGGNYKKIYALEPDSKRYAIIHDDISRYGIERVELLQKGVWSDSRELHFTSRPFGSSSISQDGTSTISTLALDSLVDKATFIKMDIEGAELEALKGARHIIQRCAPKLAICIYHKKKDVCDILEYILELIPDYKLYIRHHACYMVGTVVYATM